MATTTYIMIEISGNSNPSEQNFEIYEVNTDEEIEEAQRALREVGQASAKVLVGEYGSEDSHENGQILFAE